MRTIRLGTFETNSSSTHALCIMTKKEYQEWQENKKVLNLYRGCVEDLTEKDKNIIRNEDGSIEYNGEIFSSEYDFMEDENYYDIINDGNATKEYIYNYAEVEQKELGDNIIMSVYRGERW